MMIKFLLILPVLLTAYFSYGRTINNFQGSPKGFAKIRFVDKNEDHSKTYLGKLTKGDIANLKYELQQNFSDPPENFNDRNRSEMNGYVDRITANKTIKKWNRNRQRAKNDLIGNYEFNDDKSLEKVKEKKLKLKEERTLNKDISGNYKKYSEENNTKLPTSHLSKHFRITGKKIHNGQTFRKKEGNVCLIIKYKISEGNYTNTYVDIVEDYIKGGSNYNLKYHGNGSKRKYYLEYVPIP